MKTRIHSFQWYKATLALALVLLHPTANAQTWQRNTDTKNQSPLQWNLVNQDTGSKNKSPSGSVSFPQWKAVEPAEIIHAETEIKNSDSEKYYCLYSERHHLCQ